MDKGYFVDSGYMGWVPWLGRYILFASQSDHEEYIEKEETNVAY